MSKRVPSLSPSPKRRALHERKPSYTNQLPATSTLRLVKDDEPNEVNVYSASPYPSKPQQVLMPTAGRTQNFPRFDCGGGTEQVSQPFQSPTSPSTTTVTSSQSEESFTSTETVAGGATGRAGSVSKLSSVAPAGTSSSQIWIEDPKSSKIAIANPPIQPIPQPGDGDSGDSTENSPVAAPKTIKAVPAEPSTPSPPSTSRHHRSRSSPGESSPNIISLASSSPNLVAVGSSSPNVVRTKLSDSSLYSDNTFGTARRYTRTGLRNQPSVASYIYSDLSDEPGSSQSIPSSPPGVVLRSFRSASSIALPAPEHGYISRTRASSKSSTPSASDVQSVSSGGPPIRYPVVRAPSSTGSLADTSNAQKQQMSDRSGRWNPHLSTVPSEWTAERRLSALSSAPSPSSNATVIIHKRQFSGSHASWSLSQQSAERLANSESESSDRLRPLRPVASALSLASSLSRISSLKSLNRPGSSNSNILHLLPSWTRIYYSNSFAFLSTLSLVEGSRPSTAATEGMQVISPVPGDLSRPRTRGQQQALPQPLQLHPPSPQQHPQLLVPDTRDPRTHWRDGSNIRVVPSTSSADGIDPMNWSPHLVQDQAAKRKRWKPPSLDEAAEGLLSRRNAQIYLFCLGFIFPLAWFLASVLPLPPKLDVLNVDATTSRPDLENALQTAVSPIDAAGHDSAKWWRTVNRVMSVAGVAVIAVVVTLAVLGSRGSL